LAGNQIDGPGAMQPNGGSYDYGAGNRLHIIDGVKHILGHHCFNDGGLFLLISARYICTG